MSDTPETDEAMRDAVITSSAGDSLPKYTAMVKHARKLERQRDAYAKTLRLIVASPFSGICTVFITDRHPELSKP